MLRLLILATCTISLSCQALTLEQKIPELIIDNKGQIVMADKDKFAYQAWDSNKLESKRWLIQHISPLPSISTLNVEIPRYLNSIDTPNDNCRTITIINNDEAMWGTKGIIKSQLKQSLKLNPRCNIIVDSEGVAKERWQLKDKSYYVAVIDEQQKVLFLQEGKLSDEQINQVMRLLGVPEKSVSQSQ